MFLETMRLNVKRYILVCKHHINKYLKIQCFPELKISYMIYGKLIKTVVIMWRNFQLVCLLAGLSNISTRLPSKCLHVY